MIRLSHLTAITIDLEEASLAHSTNFKFSTSSASLE